TTQPEVVLTPRIGIDYAEEAKDWPERYCWKDHPSLSR
ncbi:3-methyladenine DNA glycosylase, partial [Acinetobacter baumannii]